MKSYRVEIDNQVKEYKTYKGVCSYIVSQLKKHRKGTIAYIYKRTSTCLEWSNRPNGWMDLQDAIAEMQGK